jgi:hypothetical protein
MIVEIEAKAIFWYDGKLWANAFVCYASETHAEASFGCQILARTISSYLAGHLKRLTSVRLMKAASHAFAALICWLEELTELTTGKVTTKAVASE